MSNQHPPIVKGGQGRSVNDITNSATAITWLCAAALVVVTAMRLII